MAAHLGQLSCNGDPSTFRATPHYASEHMGKGDKRTKKGKIFRGSFGKRRPRKVKKTPVAKKRA
jgi:30S ribosomal protein S31